MFYNKSIFNKRYTTKCDPIKTLFSQNILQQCVVQELIQGAIRFQPSIKHQGLKGKIICWLKEVIIK